MDRVAAAGVALTLLLTGPTWAESPPSGPAQNDGWVTDRAGLLTPQQEQALETLMESYKLGSGHEIALLTLPDLGGRSLEQVALETARGWGIGQQERHNGALLLVAQAEREMRIEVGRGLEGNLTDLIAGRIIRDVIAPELKRGRFYEGLRAGIEAMHAAAGGEYGKIPDRGGRSRGSSGSIGLLPLIFFVVWLVLSLLRSGGGPKARGRRRRGGSDLLPWLLLGLLSGRGGGSSGWGGGGGGRSSGGGFGGFGGGGGFSGGGASGRW